MFPKKFVQKIKESKNSKILIKYGKNMGKKVKLTI